MAMLGYVSYKAVDLPAPFLTRHVSCLGIASCSSRRVERVSYCDLLNLFNFWFEASSGLAD